MVAGHLQEKNQLYYIVLSYKNLEGKRKNKWIPTGLKVKGNKKKAQQMLMEARKNFKISEEPVGTEMMFSDYMLQWLEIIRPTIAVTTYAGYVESVEKIIVPYFKTRGTTLRGLKAIDIQNFYLKQLETKKATTVLRYHVNIHQALKYAVKIDLIDSNPADKVQRPKKERFVGSFYSSEEMEALFEAAKGTKLEIPIFLGAFYGLRRSEALGLKWDAVDFENNTITIRHTVTCVRIHGDNVQVERDTTKTKSSMRTLPLVDVFKDKLLEKKRIQEECRRICRGGYNRKYQDYICVDEMGNLIQPNYVTGAFRKLLEKNGLRRIRYHDLRHSCASLLLANGVPMKQIQEWLGHSDFSTTANVYAHLDYNAKLSSASAMESGMESALDVFRK
ncbi:MAG: site-specific integrase [Eubacterium sp.]|nr:site-specific integrase [Eubacterium sp.]